MKFVPKVRINIIRPMVQIMALEHNQPTNIIHSIQNRYIWVYHNIDFKTLIPWQPFLYNVNLWVLSKVIS